MKHNDIFCIEFTEFRCIKYYLQLDAPKYHLAMKYCLLTIMQYVFIDFCFNQISRENSNPFIIVWYILPYIIIQSNLAMLFFELLPNNFNFITQS